MLLGRPWIHRQKAIPSIYHQCLKGILKGKRVHINATRSPFQRDKVNFLEAAYFDELTEEGEVTPARPCGVPMSIQEDLKG